MNFDNVHNYYEKLVFTRALLKVKKKGSDPDYLEDIACVALNHLPPRYIRYDVDMIFYLAPEERLEMEQKVDVAIDQAIELIAGDKSSNSSKKR